LAIATEGASRIGFAYSFHKQAPSFSALCEVLIAKTLIRKEPLSSVCDRVGMLFAMAPQQLCFSPLWFAQIVSTVDVVCTAQTVDVRLPAASLSIEPLYHQDRMLSETMVLGKYALPLPQHTAMEGVEEILIRHIKAASKRLRLDQIAHIDITLPYGTGTEELRTKLSAMILTYPDPIVEDAEYSAEEEKSLHDISKKIRFHSSESAWKEHWRVRYKTLGSLYATATSFERGSWINQHQGVGRASHFLLERVLGSRLSIEEFSFSFPISVELYTTRGGCWKAKRSEPKGVFLPI
jgi:hypothetical protein